MSCIQVCLLVRCYKFFLAMFDFTIRDYQKLELFFKRQVVSDHLIFMREIRLYKGSDGGSKGPRHVNCGPLG